MPIVGGPLTAEGWDVSWLGDAAGYLEGTAFPTWAGNTAVTAHVWDSNNNPGHFVNLHTMAHGDRVIIHAHGQRHIYEVRQVQQVRPDTLRALTHEEHDVLTLITCMGYDEASGKYSWRVAVKAVLIDVKSEQ
jgi:LPXTG-site transpeptidase (sortase) family protein